MPKTTQEIYEELLAKGAEAQQQANDILTAYDNRGQFSYDAMKDPMYLAAKDQYTRLGQKAMKDTMGQAAGLTGGYGNTYAKNAGNQAYDDYMTKLSSVGAEYASQARAAWDAEGQRMLDRYGLALNAANNYYNQGRDALGDQRYQDELAYARERDAISDQRYQDELNYSRQQQTLSDARSYATYLLGMGIMPNADQLAAAGMTQQEANGIKNYYLSQQYAAGGGSGGGGNPSYTPSYNPKTPADEDNEDGGPGGPGTNLNAIPQDKLIEYAKRIAATGGKGYLDILDELEAAYNGKKFDVDAAIDWIMANWRNYYHPGSTGSTQPKPINIATPY